MRTIPCAMISNSFCIKCDKARNDVAGTVNKVLEESGIPEEIMNVITADLLILLFAVVLKVFIFDRMPSLALLIMFITITVFIMMDAYVMCIITIIKLIINPAIHQDRRPVNLKINRQYLYFWILAVIGGAIIAILAGLPKNWVPVTFNFWQMASDFLLWIIFFSFILVISLLPGLWRDWILRSRIDSESQ
jgi:hypothetical protein